MNFKIILLIILGLFSVGGILYVTVISETPPPKRKSWFDGPKPQTRTGDEERF